MQESGSIKFWIHPILDWQRTEHARTLFLRDKRAKQVDDWKDADFTIIDAGLFKQEQFFLPPGKKVIALCLSDLALNYVGLRPGDNQLREKFFRDRNTLIYVVIDTRPVLHSNLETLEVRRINLESNGVYVLTAPLGYFAGSKQNICYPDNDDSVNFLSNFKKNPKRYKWDWCWIGTESARDRNRVLEKLKTLKRSKVFFHSDPVCLNMNPHMRRKELHADNREIPYDEFLDIHRKSKVSISCNGWGMWCYKDAELLSRNCFVLRQYHANLNLNRLSPIDGKHWVVFNEEDLEEKLDYYVRSDIERERINDAGYEYFVNSIRGGWAKEYVTALEFFLNNGDTSFNGLRYS